ncbi:hypothetical protein BD289DRAFT_422247 [Coniella lustricola]|uniref:Uncharacterized protein n=1 Tax=Coniella lustricola TaxID=2025994 RepID=A0A2T3AKP7_9PEZI|nr:hypothetical protein BD289DRAFT_422247 [Coniella lustricola]
MPALRELGCSSSCRMANTHATGQDACVNWDSSVASRFNNGEKLKSSILQSWSFSGYSFRGDNRVSLGSTFHVSLCYTPLYVVDSISQPHEPSADILRQMQCLISHTWYAPISNVHIRGSSASLSSRGFGLRFGHVFELPNSSSTKCLFTTYSGT